MASQFEEVLAMRKMVQVESLGVEEDETVIEARTRTYVKWINGCLHSKEIHIMNLDADLENGVVLIKLVETLAHGIRIPGRYYGHPVIRIPKVQNQMVAFRFLTKVEKIPLMNIKLGYEKSLSGSHQVQNINCDHHYGGLSLAAVLASYPGILPWSRGMRVMN